MLPSPRRDEDTELVDELLLSIERRRVDRQRRLDEIARRRAVMAPGERAAAREAAVELRDELARLDLLASVVIQLLAPTGRVGRVRPVHPL